MDVCKAVTAAQMKQIEKNANDIGISYEQMMENAGTAAYRQIRLAFPTTERLIVIVGKGNNGGDGLVVARLAAMDKLPVQVVLAEGMPVTEDAAINYKRIEKLPVEIVEMEEAWKTKERDVVVDALYGTGFHGDLRLTGQRACQYMNSRYGALVALDIPSGLNADTGKAAEGNARADMTIVFDSYKHAHVNEKTGCCGKIILVDIGIPKECHNV